MPCSGRSSAPRRAEHGVERKTLLSVGHLIERKGHDLVIRALADLPDVDLLTAGDGPERHHLTQLARSLGVDGRVRFLGVIDHQDLPAVYSAADALVLASSREGWPNVLLEAMACSTPMIATRNWGTPEIACRPEAGVLVDERAAGAIAEAARTLFQSPPDRARTRSYAEGFSWDATTRGQLDLFSSLIAGRELSRAA